jgi:hypothetical protein
MDNPYIDFSGRDYTATFERLLSLLRQEVPELTDLNHSDAGISLIRLVARDSDQLAFYLDQAFAEGFVSTAKYKQSLLDLAHLTGYYPPLSSAASVTLTATRKTGETGDIDIPKYASFSTAGGVNFVTLQDYTLPSGTSTIDIEVVQGTHETMDLLPADFSYVDRSGFLKCNLGTRIADGTMEITDKLVTETVWSQVESFWRSVSTDSHFVMELFADEYGGETDTCFLVVGDGTKGRTVPTDGLTLHYVQTSESDGNVGYGLITQAPGLLVDVTNAEPATGGSAVWDTEQLRTWLPVITQTQRRAVTLEDYEALVESVAGIRQVQALDRSVLPVWPHMYVILYAVPAGGGPMSQLLQNNVMAVLKEKGHLGDWDTRYLLFDAVETSVDVTCSIRVASGYQSATVIAALTTVIQDFFDPDTQDVGDDLDFSTLHLNASRVPGVSWINFTQPSGAIVGTTGHIFTYGTVTVTAV